MVDKILDTAGKKGTGKWTEMSAMKLGTPVTLIGESVFARCLSAIKEERVSPSKILSGPRAAASSTGPRIYETCGGLSTPKIIRYAQGYMLLREAAKK